MTTHGAASSTPLSDADLATLLSGENAAYVEALFQDYLLGRGSVPATWRALFDRLAGGDGADGNGGAAGVPATPAGVARAPMPGPAPAGFGVFALVDAYRSHGHLIADLDPLGRPETSHPLLEHTQFGFDEASLQQRASPGHFLGSGQCTPAELIESLRDTYCGTFAVEFMEMRERDRHDWLIRRMEPVRNRPSLSARERLRILSDVMRAERFEQFLHKRFLGQKRFSLEGGESLIPLLDFLIEDAAELGIDEIVLGMAHRGRLNVMAHTFGMPYRALLAGFQTTLMPRDAQGAGDVKYHRGYSADRLTHAGRKIHLSLCPNPSHLEAINPVVCGMVRAKQNWRGDSDRSQVMAVQIHGDAAFTGQGVVAETLALSELETYWTGGTIHIIVNNQIGFTTDPEDYRFTRYPSDMAKVIQAPVFHVNADDPEACVHAARLAIAFRQHFKEDVILDLVCYRRHGHNEGDDPTFTQPRLYEKIASHPTVTTLYTERLVEAKALEPRSVEDLEARQAQSLERGLEESVTQIRLAGAEGYRGLWHGFEPGNRFANWQAETALPRTTLERVSTAMTTPPSGFHVHRKLERLLAQRKRAIEEGRGIDWSTGEALALGSILLEGITIRMTGQDVERGTFSQRHAVLHDVRSGGPWVPLAALCPEDTHFFIHNSLLSEAAVLGFEYGYSTVDPRRLAIWEAQFGDFANSAQVIIDQFIASGERKWGRASGLVLLLPHGYEGQGPEHSSARLERFLQLCAEDNLQVIHPTTPAQYFHALRRQVCRKFRKPLIVMSPKSLLRHPGATSSLADLEHGFFEEVIDDPSGPPGGNDGSPVRRVLLCSGKVFYALLEAREEGAFQDVALLRLEQIHPFPFHTLRERLAAHGARDVVWVQEEPWNMGAWSFVRDRIGEVLPEGASLRYVGRPESASPATGSYKIHEEEETTFVREAFARRPRERVVSR